MLQEQLTAEHESSVASSIKWMNWRGRQKTERELEEYKKQQQEEYNNLRELCTRFNSSGNSSLQLQWLDAVNICGLMCGLMCRFDVWTRMRFNVVILCQWFAADVWNVNCCYLIARLNSYVVSLCSSDNLELLLWWIDCTPRGRTRTGHVIK
jgi:hypothetical protein